ncbi:MAG: hypothetical protein II864_12640 [Prevotella sp.]|jgi:hypothetical protein|nr:hypothetical protein [Prevotella sp.]
MKKYDKPSIEVLEVETEQLMDVSIVNEEADVEGGYYKDSRLDIFDEE